MNPIIVRYLGLPPDSWPPNHYQLLGLPPSEADPANVEAAVHDRMDKLRAFQLSHPEDVTEAMNRLAQALVTLSDASARTTYDAHLHSTPPLIANESTTPSEEKSAQTAERGFSSLAEPTGVEPFEVHQPRQETVAEYKVPSPQPMGGERRWPDLSPTGFAWRQPGDPDYYEVVPVAPVEAKPAETTPQGPPPLPVRPPTEVERRQPSEWALLTPPASITGPRLPSRIDATRVRIHALKNARDTLSDWDRVGDYLAVPQQHLGSRAEAAAVVAALRRIAEDPPPARGGSGRAVLELAASRPTIASLIELPPARREELAESWRKGRQELRGEYLVARQSVGRHPHGRHLRRALLRLRRWLPEIILLVAACLALTIAVVRGFILG